MGEADELPGDSCWWEDDDSDTVVDVKPAPKPLVVKAVSPFNTTPTPLQKAVGILAALEVNFSEDVADRIVDLFTTLPLAQRDAVRKRLAKIGK